jgi:hypothetical protein
MSNIYDNLNIVETTVTYDGRTVTGSFAISQNDFDLSTLNFLPNVPYEDQIEVERIFDTGIDSKFDEIVFTIADRRNMFVLAKDWYTINPQTKRMTINIPSDTVDDNGLYYPESRTYMTEGVVGIEISQRVDIPNTLQAVTAQYPYPPGDPDPQLVTREPDVIIIRRKTLSKDSIVTFAPGTRLTTTQLNLQFNQLKFILQELIAKVRNEVILKYDENAIDGPFLGNTDLKMSGRYIKQVASPSIKDVNTETGYPFEVGNTVVQGKEFVVNHSKLLEALFFTTMHRTGLTEGDAAFSGHFTAAAQDSSGGPSTNRKIVNLADGTDNTDAATFGQVKNATNISTGILTNSVLLNIPLSKLSTASGQTFTLPVEYLANSGVTASSSVSAGSTSASNTNNMVSMTVDNKGRVTTIASRNMAVEDLPTVLGLTAGTYGQNSANNSNNMLQIGVDAKGRITSISQRTFGNNDLPTSGVNAAAYGAASGTGTNTLTRFTVDNKGIITSAAHRNIEVNDLPSDGVTLHNTYGQSTAGNTNNMIQLQYDAKGRVLLASHRNMGTADLPSNIPLTKLSSGLSQGYELPVDAIKDGSIVIGKVAFATAGKINNNVLPTIDLANINPNNATGFVLPETAVPAIPATNTAASTWTTFPIKDFSVDAKGRIFGVSHRAIADGDIPSLSADKITSGTFVDALIPAPTTAPTAGTYGTVNQVPVINVDAKGRINTITNSAALQTTNLSDFASATDTRIDNRAISKAGGANYTAGNLRIINLANPTADQDAVTRKFITDSYTTTANLGSAVLSTIQSNSVYWDSTNSIFTASRSSIDQKITGVAQPTANNHAVNKQYADTTFQTISGLSGSVVPLVTANALAWDSVNSVYTANNGSNRRIANVANPTNAQDVVTKNYLESNALVVSGGVISAATTPITNMTMRAPASIGENDAVNYGFIQNLVLTPGTTLVGSTTPQIYRDAWSALSKTSGHLAGFDRYQRTFTDLGAVNSFMILLEADSVTKTFVPYSAAALGGGSPTVHDGYFWLDTSGANKVLNIWLTTGTTPSGNLVTRNFGLSRLVSGATATTSSTGLVSILAGNDGGINVDGVGAISLKQATSTQIGGIKQGTGLSISGTGVANVDLTDAINSVNPNKVASAKAVNDLRLASMLLAGTQQMTGKLVTVAGTASLASLNIPVATAALTSFTAGDLWNSNNTLQFRTASATKQIAFTDDATTSTKGLVQITSGNDGGIAVNAGSISLQQATSSQIGGIKQGTGLTITSGVAAVNLTDSVSTTSSSTAASATAVKAAYDYAVGVQSSLNSTNNSLTTTNNNVTNATNTANAALPKAGGTMTGQLSLASGTTIPLKFTAATPTSPTDGSMWYESNTLRMQTASGAKTIAFTDSTLSGTAAAANKWASQRTLSLGGDLSGSVSFDGSADFTLNATIANNSVTLGTDTTGNYVAAITAADNAGISVTGIAGEGTTFDITNTDRGSSQLIYGTVTLAGNTTGDTSIAAASNTQALTINAGTGLSIAGNNSTKTVTITNTATQPNNFGTVVVGTTPTATNLVADSSNASFTVNAGTGITLSANATTDTFTINNAGVTGLSGTTNHINVNNGGVGSVTLSLPQAIDSSSTPTFASVTANNLRFGSGANTISSTDTNGNINLAPDGTGSVNITKALDVDGNLNVEGTSTLVGNVTINSPSTLTLLNSEGKISLGAASSTTSINRQVSASGILRAGDLILRVPASGKAWLVPNDTITTTPVAANEIITQDTLNTALGGYVSSASLTADYMLKAGSLNAGAQALGTSNNSPFTIATNNVTRVTVEAGGGMTINSGGIGVTNGNLVLSSGKATSTATAANDGTATLTTKGYVDNKKWNYVYLTSGTGTWTSPANVTEIQVLMFGGGAGGLVGSTQLYALLASSGIASYFSATIVPNTAYTYTVGAAGSATTSHTTRIGQSTIFLGVTCGGGDAANEAYFTRGTVSTETVTGVTRKMITLGESGMVYGGDSTVQIIGMLHKLCVDFLINPAAPIRSGNGTGSTGTAITWTPTSGFIPGAGGQNRTSSGNSNGWGGVGGAIFIKYWG